MSIETFFSNENTSLQQDNDEFCTAMKGFLTKGMEFLPEHYKLHAKCIDYYGIDKKPFFFILPAATDLQNK